MNSVQSASIESADNQIVRTHFPLTDSTQTRAKEGLKNLALDRWNLYTADEQTAGRGYCKRQWTSPPNVNIYATFSLLIPSESSHLLFHVPQVATVAVAKTLESHGFNPKIKWINDLLLNEKKLCGILCEAESVGLHFYAVMIGIGLNVNMSEEQCNQLDQPATSLQIETGKPYDKEIILKSLTYHLYEEINTLLEKGFSSFPRQLNQRLAFMNQKIRVEQSNSSEILKGIFEGIDELGRMKLKQSEKIIILQDGRILRDTN